MPKRMHCVLIYQQSTILEYEDYTVVYRRFGVLVFIAAITNNEVRT